MRSFNVSDMFFYVEELFIVLLLLYVAVGKKRNVKELSRDVVMSFFIVFLFEVIDRFSMFRGLRHEVGSIVLFLLTYLYLAVVYRKKDFFVIGLLIYILIVGIHVSMVDFMLHSRGRILNALNIRHINETFINYFEWVIAPDIVIFPIVLKIKNYIDRNGVYFKKFEKILIIVSVAMFMLLYHNISYFLSFFSGNFSLKGNSFNMIVKEVYRIDLILLVVILLNVYFFIVTSVLNRKLYIRDSEEMLKNYTESYLKKADEYNENISKIMHDFKNHMVIVNSMIDDSESAKRYIEPLIEEMKDEKMIMTGNSIADVVFNEKIKDMEKYDIQHDIKVAVPPDIKVEDIDMASIFFNSIDNAIEACSHLESGRWIKIRVFVRGNKLIYNICNPFNENASGKRNHAVKNLKLKKLGSGIIREIVGKYNGDLSITSENGIYCLKMFIEIK